MLKLSYEKLKNEKEQRLRDQQITEEKLKLSDEKLKNEKEQRLKDKQITDGIKDFVFSIPISFFKRL